MNNQHILLDYDNYVKDYKSIYGENTIILIQLGSFFEMCSDIDNNNDIGEKNIHNICDNVLDIAVGKKYYSNSKKKCSKTSSKSFKQIFIMFFMKNFKVIFFHYFNNFFMLFGKIFIYFDRKTFYFFII